MPRCGGLLYIGDVQQVRRTALLHRVRQLDRLLRVVRARARDDRHAASHCSP
jgi:hypothetical protein